MKQFNQDKKSQVIAGIKIHTDKDVSMLFKNPKKQDKHMPIIKLHLNEENENNKEACGKKTFKTIVKDTVVDEYIDDYWLLNINKKQSVKENSLAVSILIK